MDFLTELQTKLGSAYTLRRELGGGGMSRVFVAEESALGREVVVKVLPSDMAGQLSIERFKREIRVAASLQQANIVPVLTAGDAGGVPFYTMPLVPGESLRARLVQGGALTVAECVAILRDIAKALAYAHAAGIVHRDIKPENVLLSGGTAVVTDFGIAKAVEASQQMATEVALTQFGTVLGTPAYMAPEQAVGDTAVDHRADLYSLGVLAYEILTGAPPFTGRSPQAMIAAHITERPVPISVYRANTPGVLGALVMSCLMKDPQHRPQSANEVLSHLDAVSLTRPAPLAESTRPAVAVLPLASIGSSSEDDYFSDGITEDIIAHLSAIGGLKVISRTSVMRYKHSKQTLAEIAHELRASHIVEGSIRRAGDRLRVVAQLIDARADELLWAQTFDRELTDVFAIQSEVAERVAIALRSRLTADVRTRLGKRPTQDMEAYNLFLLGRQAYHSPSGSEPFARAAQFLQQAIDRDQGFARAYAWLALVHMYNAGGYYGVKPHDAWARALPLAAKAFELDPHLAESELVFGWHAHWVSYDWPTAQRHFDRAHALNPSDAFVCIAHVGLRTALRHPDDVLAWIRLAEEVDPSSPLIRLNAVVFCWMTRQFDEALAELTAARGLTSSLGPLLPVVESMLLVALHREAEAAPLLSSLQLQPLDNWSSLMVATNLALCGDHRAARGLLAKLHARESTEYVWTVGLACAYGALGEIDRAFEYLGRAYDDRAAWMTWLESAPCFDSLRSDLRFDRMIQRLGLPAIPVPPSS